MNSSGRVSVCAGSGRVRAFADAIDCRETDNNKYVTNLTSSSDQKTNKVSKEKFNIDVSSGSVVKTKSKQTEYKEVNLSVMTRLSEVEGYSSTIIEGVLKSSNVFKGVHDGSVLLAPYVPAIRVEGNLEYNQGHLSCLQKEFSPSLVSQALEELGIDRSPLESGESFLTGDQIASIKTKSLELLSGQCKKTLNSFVKALEQGNSDTLLGLKRGLEKVGNCPGLSPKRRVQFDSCLSFLNQIQKLKDSEVKRFAEISNDLDARYGKTKDGKTFTQFYSFYGWSSKICGSDHEVRKSCDKFLRKECQIFTFDGEDDFASVFNAQMEKMSEGLENLTNRLQGHFQWAGGNLEHFVKQCNQKSDEIVMEYCADGVCQGASMSYGACLVKDPKLSFDKIDLNCTQDIVAVQKALKQDGYAAKAYEKIKLPPHQESEEVVIESSPLDQDDFIRELMHFEEKNRVEGHGVVSLFSTSGSPGHCITVQMDKVRKRYGFIDMNLGSVEFRGEDAGKAFYTAFTDCIAKIYYKKGMETSMLALRK